MFADLESQLDAADANALAGEIADRSRRESALVSVMDRLRASTGPVTVGLPGHLPVCGSVAGWGADWVLLVDGTAEVLVVTSAATWLRGLTMRAEPERSALGSRLDLGYALRGIARDRAPVALLLVDGSVASGTIDRVGRDFVDMAEHHPDEPRRAEAVRTARTVLFAAITAIRRS